STATTVKHIHSRKRSHTPKPRGTFTSCVRNIHNTIGTAATIQISEPSPRSHQSGKPATTRASDQRGICAVRRAGNASWARREPGSDATTEPVQRPHHESRRQHLETDEDREGDARLEGKPHRGLPCGSQRHTPVSLRRLGEADLSKHPSMASPVFADL